MRRFLTIFGSVLMLAGCSEPAPAPQAGGAVAGCQTRAYDHIGGPISLIDHTGKAITEADFKGAPSLVFFGFTYCPGICPGTLVTIERALRRLPEEVEVPRTLLISVDPERDTPEALARYISTNAFPDNIIGLTGSLDAVKAAADVFVAPFSRIEDPDSLAEYTVEHSSLVYLMDENWTLKTFFTYETTAEIMAECLEQHLG